MSIENYQWTSPSFWGYKNPLINDFVFSKLRSHHQAKHLVNNWMFCAVTRFLWAKMTIQTSNDCYFVTKWPLLFVFEQCLTIPKWPLILEKVEPLNNQYVRYYPKWFLLLLNMTVIIYILKRKLTTFITNKLKILDWNLKSRKTGCTTKLEKISLVSLLNLKNFLMKELRSKLNYLSHSRKFIRGDKKMKATCQSVINIII